MIQKQSWCTFCFYLLCFSFGLSPKIEVMKNIRNWRKNVFMCYVWLLYHIHTHIYIINWRDNQVLRKFIFITCKKAFFFFSKVETENIFYESCKKIKGFFSFLSHNFFQKKLNPYQFSFVLWHINHCRLFNAKSIFIHINSSISNNSVQHKNSFLFTQSLNVKNSSISNNSV